MVLRKSGLMSAWPSLVRELVVIELVPFSSFVPGRPVLVVLRRETVISRSPVPCNLDSPSRIFVLPGSVPSTPGGTCDCTPIGILGLRGNIHTSR